MPTHAAVAGFDRSADTYERGRPDYPAAAVTFLLEAVGLEPGDRVVDLGAGTGKFTRSLRGHGLTVVPVEPTRAMRLVLHRVLPDAPVIAAAAEQLPLRTATCDAAVAAQAFHWFAGVPAVDEIARVVRPGGGLGLVWNTRDESVPWAARLGALIERHSAGIPRHRSGAWKKFVDGRPEFEPMEHRRFPHAQRASVETLVDRVLSISVIALLPPEERRTLEHEVRELLTHDPATAGREFVELPYQTDVYVAHRR